MRGISSIFGAKRSEKPPSHPPSSAPADSRKPQRLFGSLSRKTTVNNQGPSSVAASAGSSEPLQSSGSSSSGSQLRTPGDDESHLHRSNSKTAWMSWIGGGKKSSDTAKKPKLEKQWSVPSREEWRSRPVPPLRQPPRGLIDESEDDSTSSESEEESDALSVPDRRVTITSSTITTARNNLCAMIENSQQPPFSPPPLLHVERQPSYPRSSNSRRSLYKHDTMETLMHKARILRRLSHQDLTRPEELSIVSLGLSKTLPAKRPSLVLDDQAVPRTHRVRKYSQGLQTWALRPCFEDRMDVWMPEGARTAPGSQTVLRTRVTGTNFGVAALEISEFTDLLAGAAAIDELDIPDQDQAHLPLSATISNSSLPIPSHQGQNAPSLPSPLRMEHHSSPSIDLTLSLPVINIEETPDMPAAVPAVKRGVRFAEDDKDDIPLGYVLRVKKRKEEKARFLQEEKERRAYEEDRARQEAERLQREAERQEWENERKAWEKEKRAMEEERRQRQYAEEVAAARSRRDASRSGFYVSSTGNSTSRNPARPGLTTTQSAAVHRDTPSLPPQRQASDSAVGLYGSGSSPYNQSPSSSNPPSVHEASPTGSGFFARPLSTSSANTTLSSAEDMQIRKNNASKRNSVASTTSAVQQRQSQVIPTMPQFYPVWSNPYAMPVYPGMAMYGMDSPLLPPTPPFMMHQNNTRSGSPNSSSKSRSSSRNQSPSKNTSSEKLPGSSSSRSSTSRPGMQHHRRGSSDDALQGAQRPAVADRRSGSAIDIHNRRSSKLQSPTPPSTYRTSPYLPQMPSTPQQQLPQAQWSSSSLPRESRGRNASRRQSVRADIS